jgi:large subunit ribosomal protein L22
MKAYLKNYRQSPRKVRLLADLVRGKEVKRALSLLSFADKRAAGPFATLLKSAVANAKAAGKDTETLFIKHVAVDKGVTQKRFMPRARGSASTINRRASNIKIELGEKRILGASNEVVSGFDRRKKPPYNLNSTGTVEKAQGAFSASRAEK